MKKTRRAIAAFLLMVSVFDATASNAQISDAEVKAFVQGNTAFALDLYAQLKELPDIQKLGGNLFFSPYSVSTALAMTVNGARGDTAKQMVSVLRLPGDGGLIQRNGTARERSHPAFAFGYLQKRLQTQAQQGGCQFHIANALWGQKGHPFLESFLMQNDSAYGAGFNEVDYADPGQARRTINAWVEQQTKDKIEELIAPGVLTPLTRLVLTNAIYFKGDWAAQFNEEDTRPADFFLASGFTDQTSETVQVSMMYQKGTFAYADSNDVQIVSLPYEGEALSMVVVLPKADSSLASLEASLDAKRLESYLARLRERQVDVFLPKVKMTCGPILLNDPLIALGMKDAFDPDAANFSGVDGTRQLYVSHVLHKAFVEVNEEGTEAAAATAVVMTLRAMPMNPVFRADRPFLFLIRDNETGSILFMGRVMNPVQE